MSDARPDPEASCGAGTAGTGGDGSSTEAGSAAAAPQTLRVPAAMSRVSGFGTRTLMLAPRRACRSRQLIHAEYRIEIEMRVPRLVRPVPAAEALVPIHVEGRHEQNRDPLQHPGSCGLAQQLAQRNETRVLAVALAGMNTR